MKKYRFTTEDVEQAGKTNLVDILTSNGEILKKSGSEYIWNNGGEKVSIRGGFWYSHYQQKGGNAIQFVQKYMGKSFTEAVEFLIGDTRQEVSLSKLEAPKEKKPFSLPKANDRMSRTYKYLCDYRKINPYLVSCFVKRKMIYEEEKHHNIVFVGYDKDGVPRHAHIKGSYPNNNFKGNCSGSEPEFSFHCYGTNENIYLFEAPVDMLSYMTLHMGENKGSSYAASCSVSDRVLFQCLKDKPDLKNVFLCYDNDKAGQEANARIGSKLLSMGYNVQCLVPQHKDWSEDLMRGVEEQCSQTQVDLQY